MREIDCNHFHTLKMVAVDFPHKITPRKSFKKFSDRDPASIFTTPFKKNILGHAIGIDHFNPRQPHAIMNEDYIMPLMSNSTGLSTRHIHFPYVVPRLSLADIAAARNHYSMYKRFHLNHKVANFRTKTTKFQMCTIRNMRRFRCSQSRNRRRTE